MCSVVGAVMAALSVASTAYSMKQQNEYAEAMEQQAELQRLAEIEAALAAQETDMALLEQQAKQAKDSTEQDVMERHRQSLRETGLARVAASEAGVFGNSILRELANIELQESYDVSIMNSNLTDQLNQIATQAKGVSSTAKSRVNQANITASGAKASAKASRISGFSGALRIGTAGLSGYASGADIQESFKKK